MVTSYSPERLALIREVEDFLYLEADLADTHRFDEWLGLWTPELLYWVPCNADEIDPNRQVSLIYDDRDRLEERIFRLQTKQAHSQSPRSRLSRTVANVRLEGFDAQGAGSVVSRFVLAEVRGDRLTTWAGRQRHVLERTGEGLRMKEKQVLLVDNDSPMGNLTFII